MPRAFILVALLAMSSMVISDDPSCFKTDGNDIVYNGGNQCPEVTVYTKNENLKMTFGVGSTPTTTRYITMRLGGCDVDGLKVRDSNPVALIQGSDPVDSAVADGNGIEFLRSGGSSTTQTCDRVFSWFPGGHKTTVFVDSSSYSYLTIRFKDVSFDYTVLMDGFPYWILIIIAVVGVVLSVIGSVIAFICFKNSANKPTKPTKPIESTKLKPTGSCHFKNTSKGSSKKPEPALPGHFQHHGLEPIGICRPDGKKWTKEPKSVSYWYGAEDIREQKSLEEDPKAIML